jgi:hypothetical protein
MPNIESKKADRRFQIFVSSTFREMAHQRKEAIQVIVELGHIPIALDRFSAQHSNDLEVISRAISDSQIYLLIMGCHYGELVPPDNRISYTELEYELAVKSGLDILVLQMHPDDIKKRRDNFRGGSDEDRREIENEDKFQHFLGRLKSHHYKQLWKVEDGQFKFEVARALFPATSHCTKPGFILEPGVPGFAETSKNEFIVDIVTELRGFETLYGRVGQEHDKKMALAQCFCQLYANKIVEDKVNLFFESGSTIAYVAKVLAPWLVSAVRIEEGAPNMKISTNNVLAYLLLWLKMKVPCSPFPWSTPTEKEFGAWYGGLEMKPEQNPDYSGGGLDEIAKHEIKRLHGQPYRPGLGGESTLLLGAASGLQVSENVAIQFCDGLDADTRAERTAQIMRRRGPHVGSYHNKLFKRYMYDTGLPLMIFLSADKIDCPVDVGTCHYVLDDEFSWDNLCRSHPLAFCVGCSQTQKKPSVKVFEDLGFKILDGNGSSPITAFVARNAAFIKQFEDVTRRTATNNASSSSAGS